MQTLINSSSLIHLTLPNHSKEVIPNPQISSEPLYLYRPTDMDS